MRIDEVLGVGDARFSKKAEKAIKKRISGNQTVVFVSHSEAQIKSICDRMNWLKDGNIAAKGNPDEISDAYNADIQSSSATNQQGIRK